MNDFKTIKKTDHRIENIIVSNLVTSDDFARRIFQTYKSEYLQNKYFRIIISWVKKHFDEYDEAPKKHIIDLFDLNRGEINEDEYAEYDLIEVMLQSLSDDFDETVNVEYLTNKTNEYFKKRSYQILAEKLSQTSNFGEIDETQQLLVDFRTIEKELSGWIDPFNPIERAKAFESMDEDILFRMPGAVGNLLGDFRRGHLFGVLAPAKKGKTTFLQEIAVQALLNKLSVLFISLEMDPKRSQLRLYRRLSALSNGGEYKLPIFDCVHNQTNECENPRRKNKISMHGKNGINFKEYSPCSFCRDSRTEKKRYKISVWFENRKGPKFNSENSKKSFDLFNKWWKPKFRFKSWPGAKLSQIIREIDILEQTEGFIPDVIIPDYFTICASEKEHLSERGKIDATWWLGATLAKERMCFVATGHQGNRDSIDSKVLKLKHASEDIRVFNHCDGFAGLAQTEAEKRMGIIRVSNLIARDEDFISSDCVSMTCNFGLGQIMMDSEFGSVEL